MPEKKEKHKADKKDLEQQEVTKSASEKKSADLKLNYSVKLSSASGADEDKKPKENKEEKIERVIGEKVVDKPGSPSPSGASGMSDEKMQKLQQTLEAFQKNPAAFQQALQQMAGQKQNTQPSKPLSFKDMATSVVSKFTVTNFQKIVKHSITFTDGLIKFVIKKEDKDRNPVLQGARQPMIFGMWVIIVTFFIGGIWAGVAPLDSSSHAEGFVSSAIKKQLIQHREGGILEALYVTEGQEVVSGQILAKLSDVQVTSALNGFKLQKESYEKQLSIIKEQIVALQELNIKGFASKAQLAEAQQREAQVLAHLSEIESRIISTEEQLVRLSITSPVSGVVNQIQIHTIGSAVPQGAILMTITPKEENLIIEAYVAPQDIDSVYVGLKAKVRISAFKHRSVSPLDGIVTYISPDVVEPPQGHYTQSAAILQKQLRYKVTVEINKEQLKKISKYRDYELYPGMGADVSIVTGERTLLQYLLDPILTAFWHAFKEK